MCDLCVRVLRAVKMCVCVCVAVSVLNKGATCTWRASTLFCDYESVSRWCMVGPAGAGPAGAGAQRRRRSGGRRRRTAGRRPWPTLTCDADRYGDACRVTFARHERKRPNRGMREWAETVNRTEKGGGYARAFRQRRVCVDETVQTRATGTGYGDIGSISVTIGCSDPARRPRGAAGGGLFMSVADVRAGGGSRAACGDVLLRCTVLRRVWGNTYFK